MRPAVIIPARFASTRFPGKPLHMIGRRPLLEHTWRAARETGWPCWIATDDDEIEAVAMDFGARVIRTGECRNGTERCADAVIQLGLREPIIVNWQGDSPLTPVIFARAIVERLQQNERVDVATPVMACSAGTEDRLRAEEAEGRVGGTTAVVARDGRALYFSKALIPPQGPLLMHVGLYAYRRDALLRYGVDPCPLEEIEGLEQLRFLDAGARLEAVTVPARPLWEVNNLEDVRVVESLLSALHEAD